MNNKKYYYQNYKKRIIIFFYFSFFCLIAIPKVSADECASNTCKGNSCWNGTAYVAGTKTDGCATCSFISEKNSIKPNEVSNISWTTTNFKTMDGSCAGIKDITLGGWSYATNNDWYNDTKTHPWYTGTSNKYPFNDQKEAWFKDATSSGSEVCIFYPYNTDGKIGTPCSFKIDLNMPYSCIGDKPNNATLCTNSNVDLTQNTKMTIASSCDGKTKCQYICNSGYKYDTTSGTCVWDSSNNFCQNIPKNSVPCDGTDLTKNQNATLDYVYQCDSSKPCRFNCNPGYSADISDNVCIPTNLCVTTITSANNNYLTLKYNGSEITEKTFIKASAENPATISVSNYVEKTFSTDKINYSNPVCKDEKGNILQVDQDSNFYNNGLFTCKITYPSFVTVSLDYNIAANSGTITEKIRIFDNTDNYSCNNDPLKNSFPCPKTSIFNLSGKKDLSIVNSVDKCQDSSNCQFYCGNDYTYDYSNNLCIKNNIMCDTYATNAYLSIEKYSYDGVNWYDGDGGSVFFEKPVYVKFKANLPAGYVTKPSTFECGNNGELVDQNSFYCKYKKVGRSVPFVQYNQSGATTYYVTQLLTDVYIADSSGSSSSSSSCPSNTCPGNSCWDKTNQKYLNGTKENCVSCSVESSASSISGSEIAYITWTVDNFSRKMDAECNGLFSIKRGDFSYKNNTDWYNANKSWYTKPAGAPDGYPFGNFNLPYDGGQEFCIFHPYNSDNTDGTPCSFVVDLKSSTTYQCTGTIPTNATLCQGSGQDLTVDTPYSLSVTGICDGTKCQCTCNSGYTYDSTTKTCKTNSTTYQCTGSMSVDSTFCLGSGNRLTQDTPYSISSTGSCDGTKCQCTCNSGYTYDSTTKTCKTNSTTYQCTRAIPTNATLCPETDQGLTANTPYSLSSTGSCDGTKCQCTCNSGNGYIYNSATKTCRTFQCIESIPANSTFCLGSGNRLTQDTPYSLSSTGSCDGTKCQSICDINYGYTYDSTTKTCRTFQCIESIPANSTLCSGSNQGLTQDTTYSLSVTGICDGTKCQRICNSGYTYFSYKNKCVSSSTATSGGSYVCQPDNSDCIKNTCSSESCFDGCNYLKGTKNCN